MKHWVYLKQSGGQKREEKEIRDIVVNEIGLNVDSRQCSNRNRKMD